MDFAILYAIQTIRTNFLDNFFIFITNIAGDYGQIWVYLAIALLLFKKTRKMGITILLSYGLVYVIAQYGLKDLIARPRPCHIDTSIELLVKRPSSYSCPSTHSAWAFGAATSIFLYNKKFGLVTYLVATIIAFSRLYMFVHFPSDVLFGITLGIIFAFISYKLLNNFIFKGERNE